MRCLLFLYLVIIAQINVGAQHFDSVLKSYNDKFIYEKAYVHFDKPYYKQGETIWFKAYLFAGNQPSAISTSFYAELIDEEGNVLERKNFLIKESSTHGDFEIPRSVNYKHLMFRGYTTWMLNFDTVFLFTKSISIHQPDPSDLVNKNETILKFLPEGGDLVAGLTSTIAFKATDREGFPLAIAGVIKNGSDKIVDSFKTIHDGMGKMKLKPEKNTSYYAEWRNDKQETQRTDLPAAREDGIVLEAIQDNKGQHIIVTRKENADSRFKTVYVIAQMNHQVVYKAKANLNAFRAVKGTIQLDSLSTGILLLTVFDESWQPLAERITFINKEDKLFPASVNMNLRDAAKRKKNVIEIELPDDITANLSIAVTDARIIEPTPFNNNIISSLLLTADLRGFIHNPAYYFSSNEDSVKKHLDLVMLTHGWRNYDWKAIANGKIPSLKFERDNYLTIKGSLTDKGNLKNNTKQEVNLILQSSFEPKQVYNVPLSKDGNFLLDGLIFYDTTKVFYSFARPNKTSINSKLDINTLNQVKYSKIFKPHVPSKYSTSYFHELNTELQEVPYNNTTNNALDTVTVKSTKKTKLQEMDLQYTTGFFQIAESAAVINVVDDPVAVGSDNVIEYIKMKYPIIKQYNEILVWGSAITSIYGGPTATEIYLNEAPAYVQDLKIMRMKDVAYIKFYRPPFTFARQGGAGGAIAIYTKRGYDLENDKQVNKSLSTTFVNGYSSAKIFYSPDYATFTPPTSYQDVRTTLYWNPQVLLNSSNRKQLIQFYNNDFSTPIRIIVEGINEEGQLTRVEKVVE